jgi:hypothetical protein
MLKSSAKEVLVFSDLRRLSMKSAQREVNSMRLVRHIARALAFSAAIVGAAGLPRPLLAQWSCVSGICSTSGSVGIGTTSPSGSLGVYGGAVTATPTIGAASSDSHVMDLFTSLGPGSYNAIVNSGDIGIIFTNGTVGSGNFVIAPWASATSGLRITSSGKVGIGSSAPTHELTVIGTISAKEVIVTSSGADYVFDPDYRPAPLNEVADYIRQNHHLPEIPSAKEVEGSGLGVGEMQTKLLAKIEELTLHVIEGEERGLRLDQQNRDLANRILVLEGRSRGPGKTVITSQPGAGAREPAR